MSYISKVLFNLDNKIDKKCFLFGYIDGLVFYYYHLSKNREVDRFTTLDFLFLFKRTNDTLYIECICRLITSCPAFYKKEIIPIIEHQLLSNDCVIALMSCNLLNFLKENNIYNSIWCMDYAELPL